MIFLNSFQPVVVIRVKSIYWNMYIENSFVNFALHLDLLVMSPCLRIHVGIINLLNRPSRRQKIISLALSLRRASFCSPGEIVSINLIEAVDGVSQSFDELNQRYGLRPFPNWAISDVENKFPSSWRKGQTTGGIASGLSHLDATSLITTSSSWRSGDHILILEDDCTLTCDVKKCWDYFLTCLIDANKFASNWDMLMLGAAGHRFDISPSTPIVESDTIEFAGFSYLTTMYFISEKGVSKLSSCREFCLQNMLAFDELHNALANLSKRADVEKIFAPCLVSPLVLLSSKQSHVRQDPSDCVHDTEVSAGSRVNEPRNIEPNNRVNDTIVAYKIEIECESIYWWRRSDDPIPNKILLDQFGKPRARRKSSVGRVGMLSLMLKHYNKQDIEICGSFPSWETILGN